MPAAVLLLWDTIPGGGSSPNGRPQTGQTSIPATSSARNATWQEGQAMTAALLRSFCIPFPAGGYQIQYFAIREGHIPSRSFESECRGGQSLRAHQLQGIPPSIVIPSIFQKAGRENRVPGGIPGASVSREPPFALPRLA